MSAFPFDAVIFDMDGVIVDTEYYYLGETAVGTSGRISVRVTTKL